MDQKTRTRIRDLILAAVPEDGSTIGNISLFRKVEQALEADGWEFDESAVNAVREQLVAGGTLGKGRGRGGSVFRKESAVGSDAETVDATESSGSREAGC